MIHYLWTSYIFSIMRFLLIVLLSQSFNSLHAQEYIFNHLTTRDGLASNTILSMYQNEKGYLWIGTENGLQRYDGYHFTTPATLAVRRPVNQILEDKDGTMWLRMGSTVGIFDASRFTFKETNIEEDVNRESPFFELQRDAKRNVYLIVRGAGCFYPNKDKTALSKKNTPFQVPADLNIISVADDTINHRYWINASGGLGYFDKAAGKYYSYNNNPLHHPLLADKRLTSGISQFFIDSRRRYWIERWNDKGYMEYYCYDERKECFNADTAGLAESSNSGYYDIYKFSEFNDTTVMIYGLNCMSMRENGRFTKFLYPDYSPYSIQFNVVYDVLEDREHILWVATDDGLYNTMANVNANRHLTLAQKKGRSSINCLMQDEQKNIWIGTWGRDIIVVDSNLINRENVMRSLAMIVDKNSKMVWALHQHSITKKIWIGCQAGKLMVYDPKRNKVTVRQPRQFDRSTVRQIAEDRQGRLWFGLQSGKVFWYEPNGNHNDVLQFREVHHFDGFISRLKMDRKGDLWVAVAGKGINVIDVKTGAIFKTYVDTRQGGTLSGNDIRDVLPLNDSIYLLAGDRLNVLNVHSGFAKIISLYDNFPLGKINSLQPGILDECWLSTTNGIFRYNIRSGNLIKYSQWDGLITVFNQSYLMENSLRLHNNKLIFAGNQNLVMFDPSRYKGVAIPPDVQITGFQLFNKNLPVDSITAIKNMHLGYDKNSFTIDFASLSFTQLEKLTYEYKLDGVDKDWIQVKLPQPVKYSLLPPDDYQFMVRSKNSEGVYSKNITMLSLTVWPPFWKTYWFLALVIMSIVSLLYYLHRLRLQRLLHVEQVRSKLARDLHDDMGSTLTTINILSNMALQQNVLDDRMSKNFMSKISENTSQMMESMDDIIWSINPLNDSMGKVLARMKQVAGTVFESKGIDYSFDADDTVKQLSFTMEWRREIFLIYKEAVNNIVKYAQCTNVNIVLQKSNGSFVMMIWDNGVGFDLHTNKHLAPTRGNGFINMHKRAEAMKGGLLITSRLGEGTEVRLSIPLV